MISLPLAVELQFFPQKRKDAVIQPSGRPAPKTHMSALVCNYIVKMIIIMNGRQGQCLNWANGVFAAMDEEGRAVDC